MKRDARRSRAATPRALHALASEARRAEPVAEELARFEQLLWRPTRSSRAPCSGPCEGRDQARDRPRGGERLGLSPLTRNFLALVAQRRRLDVLGEILAAYRARVDEAAGRIRARPQRRARSDAERAALRERLGRRLGKTVCWTPRSTRASSAASSPRSGAGSWT